MMKNDGYYLNYPAFLSRAISDYRRSIRYARYWRKVERKFRLKKLMNRHDFTLSFRHAGLFADIVYDDERRIEAIANYYGYDMVDETLLSRRSIYKFVLKKTENP